MSSVLTTLLSDFASAAANDVATRAMSTLMHNTTTLSGDDSGLKTAWDEICVQVQGEESHAWEIYPDVMCDAIKAEVAKLDSRYLRALWLKTESGWNWLWDSEHNAGDTAEPADKAPCIPYDIEEIAEHILETALLPMAEDYSNDRISTFLYGDEDGSESDEDDTGSEDDTTHRSTVDSVLAKRIATEFLAMQQDGERLRVEQVDEASELGLSTGYGGPDIEWDQCWVAYCRDERYAPMLKSSQIIVISKLSGNVLYFGSTNDEG